MALIECIPNVSEGRRADVVAACAEAIGTAGGRLLDVSCDPSHNRAVYTFAGSPADVRRAVVALFDAALPRIDLRLHTGVHPRIGAVDVVPFVPLAGTTMAACVELARTVAAEVADRHGLPVYLYEQAATTPARRRLEYVRRGQFEGLAARMRLPEWAPDFGPAAPHPSAGASAFGARMPLIAYNVNLATTRLEVARAIAAAVRESSGGLPAVKAMGVPLADQGLVQVSMNLTNFRKTSLGEAFGAVRREANRHGVAIAESEIVGLIPADAMAGIDPAALRLQGFNPRQILERRLAESDGGPAPDAASPLHEAGPDT